MHLLYVATYFGALTNTFVAREVSALRRRGHRVDLLALRRSQTSVAADPECDLTGCRYVYPVSRWRVLAGFLRLLARRPRRMLHAMGLALGSRGDSLRDRLLLLWQLAVSATQVRAIEETRPDLIHAHLAGPPGGYAMFLGLLTGIPYSFTGHAADLYRRPVGNRAKLRHSRGAVAISRYNLAHYRALVPDVRAAVVHCGVRLADFPFRRRTAAGQPLRILAVGRAVPKKGFHHLLSALAQLDGHRHPWRAHLVGGGPLLADLREQAAGLGLDWLEITGPRQQSEVRDLLAEADVFVLPCVEAEDGDIDGIPVSLMEAMASGCPVISTRISGIPELLADGEAGLLVPPGDPGALAAALTRLAAEPGLVGQLSRSGREQVERDFDADREADRLAAVFAAWLADREAQDPEREDSPAISRS